MLYIILKTVNPNVGTAPTMNYSTICYDCFGPIMQMYHAAFASDRFEPKVQHAAKCTDGSIRRLAETRCGIRQA